jgi:hypothetical protein
MTRDVPFHLITSIRQGESFIAASSLPVGFIRFNYEILQLGTETDITTTTTTVMMMMIYCPFSLFDYLIVHILSRIVLSDCPYILFGSVCLIVHSDPNPDLVLIRISILSLAVRLINLRTLERGPGGV